MSDPDRPEGPLDVDPTGKIVKIETFQRGDYMPPEVPTTFEKAMKNVFENFKGIFSCVKVPEDDSEKDGL